jgi:hypothetical protein
MRFIRRHLLAVAATMGVLAVAAPVSSASIFTWPAGLPDINTVGGQSGPLGCGSNAPAGNGPAGGTTGQACGSVLSFIGPAVGQVATVIGPTIIGATVLAPITVSAGPVVAR